MDHQGVILVEGHSDRAAVEALARRRGRELVAEGVAVEAMGGATNIGRYLGGWSREGVVLAALCDRREEPAYRRAFTRAGLDGGAIFVCVDDLEDELIRALGVEEVEGVVAAQGELESFRIFQNQPFQRERPLAVQLRRFLGTRSGRKIHYGRVLVEALDLGRVPEPLDGVLAAVP
jgi:hypothetical protein